MCDRFLVQGIHTSEIFYHTVISSTFWMTLNESVAKKHVLDLILSRGFSILCRISSSACFIFGHRYWELDGHLSFMLRV